MAQAKDAAPFLLQIDEAIAKGIGSSATQMEHVAAVYEFRDVMKQSLASEQVQYIGTIVREEIASIVLNHSGELSVQLRTEGSPPTVEILYSRISGEVPDSTIFTLELPPSTSFSAQSLRALVHAALDTQVRSRLMQVTKGEKPTLFHFSVGVRPVADTPPMDPMEMGEQK